MIVTRLAVAFPFVDVDYAGIFDLLWDLPFFHIDWNGSVSFCIMVAPLALYISPGITSGPGALPYKSCLMAFQTYSSVGS